MNAHDHNATATNGIVITTDTTLVEGDFYSIFVIEDATFDTLTERNATGDMTGFAVKAGIPILNGSGITAYKLASGKVRATKRFV